MKKVFCSLLIFMVLFSWVFIGKISVARGEDYPSQNIRWVVGSNPGGGFDIYSRAMAEHMEKYLPKGLHVVVENRPGAAFQIGTAHVYNAPADGYTMGIFPMPGLYLPQMFSAPKYDMRKISWLGSILKDPMCVGVSVDSKFKTVKDLQQAEVVRYPITGFSGPDGSVAILINDMLGIKGEYITGHKSSKEFALALMRGDGDATVMTYNSLRKFVKRKSLRPLLVVGSETRIPEIQDVPTASELGKEDLTKMGVVWRVIGATPNLPPARQKYLEDIVWKTLNDKEFLAWSKKAKRPVNPLNAQDTKAAMLKLTADYDRYRDLFKRYIK